MTHCNPIGKENRQNFKYYVLCGTPKLRQNCKIEPVFIHYIFYTCVFSIDANTRIQWPINPAHLLGHQCSDKKYFGMGCMWLFSTRYMLKNNFVPTNNEHRFRNGNYYKAVSRKLRRH